MDPSNPNYNFALQGMAVPLGLDDGHNDTKRHNGGDTYSIFTSWTIRLSVAGRFAGRYGVVLSKKFKLSKTIPSPDAFNEQKVLVRGIVIGASVNPASVRKPL